MTLELRSKLYLDVTIDPGNPYGRGRLITVDLPVQTSLGQLLSILVTFFTLLQNNLP
jgi:hypothetical protein